MSLIRTLQDMRNNPVNANRWLQFKNNKRGYWSLWLFFAFISRQFIGGAVDKRQTDNGFISAELVFPDC